MATIDDDLSQIERDVRTLKIEYEQYFGGGRSRPPADTQWRVESLMRRYNERMAELSTGQRFRFSRAARIVDDDRETVGCEPLCDCGTDALGCACDDCDLACELAHGSDLFVFFFVMNYGIVRAGRDGTHRRPQGQGGVPLIP